MATKYSEKNSKKYYSTFKNGEHLKYCILCQTAHKLVDNWKDSRTTICCKCCCEFKNILFIEIGWKNPSMIFKLYCTVCQSVDDSLKLHYPSMDKLQSFTPLSQSLKQFTSAAQSLDECILFGQSVHLLASITLNFLIYLLNTRLTTVNSFHRTKCFSKYAVMYITK